MFLILESIANSEHLSRSATLLLTVLSITKNPLLCHTMNHPLTAMFPRDQFSCLDLLKQDKMKQKDQHKDKIQQGGN